MQFSTSAALLAFAAAASAHYSSSSAHAHGNVTYTTQVVTAYTTYCPTATKITYGAHTYTVTEPTTLTITDCPCTVSVPVYTSSVTSCTTCSSAATPIYPTSIPAIPSSSAVKPSSVIQPIPSSNGTAPSSPVSPPKTSLPSAATSFSPSSRVNGTSPPIATYTGAAAAKMDLMGGITGAGLMGLVALML